MPTKADDQVIYGVIRTMIAPDASVLNCDMAEEATRRLGKAVSRSDVSRLRCDIGLHMCGLGSDPTHYQAGADDATAIPPKFPVKHAAHDERPRRFRNLLHKWAPSLVADAMAVARAVPAPPRCNWIGWKF